MVYGSVSLNVGGSSRRLLLKDTTICQERGYMAAWSANTGLRLIARRPYCQSVFLRTKDDDKGRMKLANILQHASRKSRDLLNGINGSSSKSHPAHHFVAGGTPCDPAPPPFHLADYGEDSLYTLVLLRHGESEWNASNQYTGWCDVNLTKKGELEARTAGRLLYENGIELDQAFTSVLKRASFSCNMALNAAQQHWVPVTKTWKLNERHYGALQGYNKDTAWKELGLDQELVMHMRRSYDGRPPRMEDDHPYWHGNDRR